MFISPKSQHKAINNRYTTHNRPNRYSLPIMILPRTTVLMSRSKNPQHVAWSMPCELVDHRPDIFPRQDIFIWRV